MVHLKSFTSNGEELRKTEKPPLVSLLHHKCRKNVLSLSNERREQMEMSPSAGEKVELQRAFVKQPLDLLKQRRCAHKSKIRIF